MDNCIGCRGDHERQFLFHAFRKVETCPCELCIVKVMCRDECLTLCEWWDKHYGVLVESRKKLWRQYGTM